MGVEPTYAAWEAAVLPMNYSRVNGIYYNSSFWKKQDKNWQALVLGYTRSDGRVQPIFCILAVDPYRKMSRLNYKKL